MQVGGHRLLAGGYRRQVLDLDAQYNVKEQQHVEAHEVEHRPVEMHRQIACQPLRPSTFPFWQDAERPLYRPENRQHSQQDLLAVNRRPPTDSEHHEGNQHDNFVYPHDDTCRQRREPQLRRILFHVRHFVHTGLLHCRLYQIGIGCACVGDIRLCLQVRVHRVTHMDELLNFLEPVRYL